MSGNYEKTYSEKTAPALAALAPLLRRIDENALLRQKEVLDAFRKNRVEARHFYPSTGYGYDDISREKLDGLFADVFFAEAAIAGPMIFSGTHAISLCLQGILRPGQKMLAATGAPYDTLWPVIGLRPGTGSLAEYGIGYGEAPLTPDGLPDYDTVRRMLRSDDYALAHIQRSRGYALRPALTQGHLEKLIALIHEESPDTVVFVDNCYGEFVAPRDPVSFGADVIAGSLIKNPGGGIAPTGGYIAGRRDIVEKISYRLTTPGLGREIGSYAGDYRPYFQGLFLAPHVASQALKTAVLFAYMFGELGFEVFPAFDAERGDIVQSVSFGEGDLLVRFCGAVQAASPVDSFVVPEPWPMPGYDDPVIMAAGAFVQGSSIELSADGPMRPPYAAYFQGGLTFEHGIIAATMAAASMER